MDSYTLDLGPKGVVPLPIGCVLRLGDASVQAADITVPVPGLHLLLQSKSEGVLIVRCGPPHAEFPHDHLLLRALDRLQIGSLSLKVLHPNPSAISAEHKPRVRPQSVRSLATALGLVAACAGLWFWELHRTEQQEQVAALVLSDTCMAMVAESVFGSGDGLSAFYDQTIRDRWLDRIHTLEIRRESLKGTRYRLHLDEDPILGTPRILAEANPTWWRVALGLQPRNLFCDLQRPSLRFEDGEEVVWEWLGGDQTGMIVPRRLERRGVPPEFLYNAQRFRGFTWPLREIAQRSLEELLGPASLLRELPSLALQAFPDRNCEKLLRTALANLGLEDQFIWELSPELAPSSKANQIARRLDSQLQANAESGDLLGRADSPDTRGALDQTHRLEFPDLDEVAQQSQPMP